MKKTTILSCLLVLSQIIFAQSAVSVTKTGKGDPILFLPGFTAPGSVWDETVKHLPASYTSHLVSYAGFNGLEPVATPWYDALKTQLLDYIKAQKLNGITIIGHSMGGNLAVDIASALPGQVKGLILVESLPCMRDLMMPGVSADSIQYNNPYNNRTLTMNDQEFKKMVMAMSQNMTNDPAKAALISTWSIGADRKTYVYGYTDLLKLDLRDKLSTINLHTLILGASFPNKEMIIPVYEKQYANLKDKEILIADNSKHFIMYDQPQWFYTQINKYLQQNAR